MNGEITAGAPGVMARAAAAGEEPSDDFRREVGGHADESGGDMCAASGKVLSVREAGHRYGDRFGCRGVSFDLWPGEVLAVVGESGSGKSTLLGLLSARLSTDEGSVRCQTSGGELTELATLSEREVRRLWRTDWGFVHQNAADGLRMHVSAGGNVGEPLMANGWRHYGQIRARAAEWLERVEIPAHRMDETPATFSGGMRQRVQIARNLVFGPRLVFMDEPTSGLDVSVQARLLDLIRSLVADLGLAVVIVTHDLAVARLISHRTLVMKDGQVIEHGLTDRVLEDPQAAYTQLLVSSILKG
ncbi:phosphonate C-P lyase system protein PhnK [Nesterenkonia alkaliphila]|nr:phosphonate C-P lyase system protein PhnK [Nesterenkonia alkaliphila]GFZ77591.1 phosphonate C-P lyase system protein PhnK [Nesterenkonia alkaliphila]